MITNLKVKIYRLDSKKKYMNVYLCDNNGDQLEILNKIEQIYERINDKYNDSYNPIYYNEDYENFNLSITYKDTKKVKFNELDTIEVKLDLIKKLIGNKIYFNLNLVTYKMLDKIKRTSTTLNDMEF